MTQAVLWWALAAVLMITELLSGTFYLLMLALAAAVGSLGALMGMPLTAQALLAAASALAALAALRWMRKRKLHRPAALNFDVGARVYVETWQGRTARAMHRGAQWDVEFAGPENPTHLHWYEIREVRGNCLIVASCEPVHAPTSRP